MRRRTGYNSDAAFAELCDRQEVPSVVDHGLTLVLPLVGPAGGPVDGAPRSSPDAWRVVAGPPDEDVALYLSGVAATRLYADRFALRAGPTVDVPVGDRLVGWSVVRAELTRMDGVDVLAMVLQAKHPLDLPTLRASVDLLRMRRRAWSEQRLPRWDGLDPGLDPWLAQVLPGARPVLDDPRALAWVFCALESPVDRDQVFALAQHDPPEMPPPPPDVRDAFLFGQGWRRWDATGTFHAFTHYGGATVQFVDGSSPRRPLRLGETHRGLYVDLAMWVARVVAARQRAVDAVADEDARWGSAPEEWAHLERRWHHPRVSEQDQGRRLVAAWLDAVESDHGHLRRLAAWLAASTAAGGCW